MLVPTSSHLLHLLPRPRCALKAPAVRAVLICWGHISTVWGAWGYCMVATRLRAGQFARGCVLLGQAAIGRLRAGQVLLWLLHWCALQPILLLKDCMLLAIQFKPLLMPLALHMPRLVCLCMLQQPLHMCLAILPLSLNSRYSHHVCDFLQHQGGWNIAQAA